MRMEGKFTLLPHNLKLFKVIHHDPEWPPTETDNTLDFSGYSNELAVKMVGRFDAKPYDLVSDRFTEQDLEPFPPVLVHECNNSCVRHLSRSNLELHSDYF